MNPRTRARVYLIMAALWFVTVLILWTKVNHCSTSTPC